MFIFKKSFLVGCIALLLGLSLRTAQTAQAGNVVLTNNTTSGSTSWFISGEASVVVNRFDLLARGITLPTRLDRVSINVASAAAGVAENVVVYQDANGGSPNDAQILGFAQVDISAAGVYTYTFPQPLTITQPFVWAGFYLPVDFQFRADRSGNSGVTYWAWQPNAAFDINNLGAAAVLGPSNGSAPVNINMGGAARINIELIVDNPPAGLSPAPSLRTEAGQQGGAGVVISVPSAAPPIRQVVGTAPDLSPLVQYDTTTSCSIVLVDLQDIIVTYRNSVRVFCYVLPDYLSPPNPEGYTRSGFSYDISMYGLETGTRPLPYRITHCFRPTGDVLDRAVFGLAFGAPRRWTILPTVRFNDLICAEVTHAGTIAYFIPNQ